MKLVKNFPAVFEGYFTLDDLCLLSPSQPRKQDSILSEGENESEKTSNGSPKSLKRETVLIAASGNTSVGITPSKEGTFFIAMTPRTEEIVAGDVRLISKASVRNSCLQSTRNLPSSLSGKKNSNNSHD